MGTVVVHEWPGNFEELAPTISKGFQESHPRLILLATIVMSRAAELTGGTKGGGNIRKFGLVSMTRRQELLEGLKVLSTILLSYIITGPLLTLWKSLVFI